jgi:hypothetical protein
MLPLVVQPAVSSRVVGVPPSVKRINTVFIILSVMCPSLLLEDQLLCYLKSGKTVNVFFFKLLPIFGSLHEYEKLINIRYLNINFEREMSCIFIK